MPGNPAPEAKIEPRSPLRILVVDDEPAIGSTVRRAARLDGHIVTSVATAEAALERLEHGAFDVLLSDLDLGEGLDGWQLAATVRTRWPDTLFWLVTGSVGVDVMPRPFGLDRILAKPFTQQDLRTALAEVVRDTPAKAA